jgi:hypothetical protein
MRFCPARFGSTPAEGDVTEATKDQPSGASPINELQASISRIVAALIGSATVAVRG